jgi:hypothetical protein
MARGPDAPATVWPACARTREGRQEADATPGLRKGRPLSLVRSTVLPAGTGGGAALSHENRPRRGPAGADRSRRKELHHG